MNNEFVDDEIQQTVTQWRERLQKNKLDGIATIILDAAEPLALVGAQLIYFSQPVLGRFMSSTSLTRWATLLENPDGVAWLRQELVETTDNNNGK